MKTVVITAYGVEGNLRPATLVFDTLRVGFPSASVIYVWTGALPVPIEVCNLCKIVGCKLITSPGSTNDIVAKWCVEQLKGEVVLCDADIVFWDNVEVYESGASVIAGRLIPKHKCEYTKLVTEERLHPSLFFIKDAQGLNALLPKSYKFVPCNPFSPIRLPVNGVDTFYDTLSILYHYLGGDSFQEPMLNCYDHLFCSSFVDEVSTKIPGLSETHKAIYDNPQLAKGMWKKQEEYFQRNKV